MVLCRCKEEARSINILESAMPTHGIIGVLNLCATLEIWWWAAVLKESVDPLSSVTAAAAEPEHFFWLICRLMTPTHKIRSR